MTYAPADLLAVQRYARAETGQAWASLGIVGDTSHSSSGGYHVGHDVLHALGTAPEDPGSDYSYVESQRDRSGLSNAASAFDLGCNFPRFLQFNAWIVGRAKAGDPRCRDIREIIHTLDGRTVKRWDAIGIRSSGDSSHLTHTHFSFFRDSEGRRAGVDNFFGLLTEFFDGAAPTPEVDDMLKDEQITLKAADGLPAETHDGGTWLTATNRHAYLARVASGTNSAKLDTTLTELAGLKAAVDELRQTPPGSVVIGDDQLERVLRRVLGSVDGSAPTQS